MTHRIHTTTQTQCADALGYTRTEVFPCLFFRFDRGLHRSVCTVQGLKYFPVYCSGLIGVVAQCLCCDVQGLTKTEVFPCCCSGLIEASAAMCVLSVMYKD